MYQALYRKYRPKTFEDVVGQEIIVKTLKNEIKCGKLNHAYLFTGPRGTGKTSIAKILAKTINCENLKDFNPCDECVSCTQINQKQTTDIIEIDAASNNGVDEIRELKSKVNLVPSTSKYKVYIIDEVHMLTVGAFNALLKTLEEPPAHIIFILATTDPHKIPSTILSRCQRFDFKRISDKKIVERLRYIVEEEQIEIEDSALYEIARLSAGGMRDSISMLDQVIAYADEKITLKDVHDINGTLSQEDMKKIIDSLINKNLEEILHIIDEYENCGKNFVKLTEEIILFLKNILLSKEVPNYFKENNSNVEIYQSFHTISNEEIISFITEFHSMINNMKISNNPKLLLELVMIKVIGMSENKEIKYEKLEEIRKETKETKEEVKQPAVINYNEKEKVVKPEKENHMKEIKENKKYFPGKVLKQGMELSLQKLIDCRINNALAGFSRKDLQNFQKNESILHNYLLNPEDGEYISMLFDGTLKALGNNYLIYVYPNNKIVKHFNECIPKLDEILTSAFEEPYHVVATDSVSWEQIKMDFNQKKKIYTFQEEPYSIDDLFEEAKTNQMDEMETLFQGIIEYQN